jgi:hypothetical protein
LGTWISEARDTAWGPLRFEFRFDEPSRLSVTGMPAESSDDDRYERKGAYQLEGDRLITPALNEGRAIRVALEDGRRRLTIGDSLEFQLRRR